MNQARGILKAVFGDRMVSYPAGLAKRLKDVKAAIFLCQLMYWHGRGDDPDWTYKTADELFKETGLSRKEQTRARTVLKQAGLIEERRKGLPAKLYFKVNLDRFVELLAEDSQISPKGKTSFDQRAKQEESKGQIFT